MFRFIGHLLTAAMILPCHAEPIISEFMADNQSTLPDEDGEYSDWIEIHNPDPSPVNLTGWTLTDSSDSLANWRVSTTAGGNPGSSDAVLFPAWLASNNQTDPIADPDGDGLSNLMEYALGGSPASDDRALLLMISFQNHLINGQVVTYPVLTHDRHLAADSVIIALEHSPDLATEWEAGDTVVSRTLHSDGTETLVHRAATPAGTAQRGFWRLNVQLRP